MTILDEQFKTPLFDAMIALAESRKVSFHTPGHKSGKGISARFRKFVGPKIFSIDLTTLDEVDSLHQPKGVIKEAQTLAASAYGADHSFFLVNGTTGGNHAMILAVCNPGDHVLLPRNAHKSVLASIIFSGARPIFFAPVIDENLMLTLNATAGVVTAAIDSHPQAKVLFLTSPNYYGICADLERIIPYAHEKGMIVLVDEAHGPHLKFHDDLPLSAMEAGADLAVQSTHKIIGGMTQASILHAKMGRINLIRLASVLRLVQTTSPSYILMASLDLARMQMATEGGKLLGKALALAGEARTRIKRIPGLFCLDEETLNGQFSSPMGSFDPTKLTINTSQLGLTGYQTAQILNTRYHIQVEMADACNILVIISIGDRRNDINRLIDALWEISKTVQGKGTAPFAPCRLPPLGKQTAMGPREAFFSEVRYLPFEEARGRISTEIVSVYPPGIPLLIPGEVVTQEILDYMEKMDRLGATLDGIVGESGARNRAIAVAAV